MFRQDGMTGRLSVWMAGRLGQTGQTTECPWKRQLLLICRPWQLGPVARGNKYGELMDSIRAAHFKGT